MSDNQETTSNDTSVDKLVEVPPVVDQAAPAPAAAAAPSAPGQPAPKKVVYQIGQTTVPAIETAVPTEDWEGMSMGPADNPSVNLTMEYTTPPIALRDRKDLEGKTEMMFFFAERGEEVDERIRTFVSPTAIRSGAGADWNESIVAAATRSAYLDRRLESTTRRPGANYMQYLQTEASRLGFTAPKIAEAGVANYSGEKAMMRVRSIMNLGGILSVPLWHSGLWVTLSAPTDGRLIELQRRIQSEKIELGRETFGLVFSNEQSYINAILLDFCMEHIYDHSVRVDQNHEIRPLIKLQDMNVLFWGMACLIWPRGFDYVRSLTTREGIENTETISAKLNLGKLMWVDNASFDAKQAAHMGNRQRNKMTVESVKTYQENFIASLAHGRRVEIRPGLEMIIASTDVDSYIADGEAWIAGIVQTVDSTFTQAVPSEQDRNRMITTHARATRLRNYGAWIKAMVIDGHENTDPVDIATTLDLLSMDDDATEFLEGEITKFIDDSTRALIAIPETSGKEVNLPRFPHLIPLDVVNTFFTLLAQRVDIISRR